VLFSSSSISHGIVLASWPKIILILIYLCERQKWTMYLSEKQKLGFRNKLLLFDKTKYQTTRKIRVYIRRAQIIIIIIIISAVV